MNFGRTLFNPAQVVMLFLYVFKETLKEKNMVFYYENNKEPELLYSEQTYPKVQSTNSFYFT